MDVTSGGHVITSTSHAHRHQTHQGPPRSSSVRLRAQLSPARPPRSYEQQLEDRLEQMRYRAKRAEQELSAEREKSRELMERMSELQAINSQELARVSTQAQQTTDSLKSRVRLMNGRCQQLTRDLQRLQEQLQLQQRQDQLGDVTADKQRLEIQLQQQQQQQQQQLELQLLQHEVQGECMHRDATTQTSAQQLELTALYQLFTEIALTRLDQLETGKHLPSRDQPPANQRRRTTSLPAADRDLTTEVTSSHHDDVTMTSQGAGGSRDSSRHHSSLLNFDLFKRLPVTVTSRLARTSDVINATYKRPITVRAPADDVMMTLSLGVNTVTSSKATSSFRRLQQRRNGLTDLSDFQLQSRDVVTSSTT